MAALRLFFPAMLTLVMLAVLLSLGTWQVQRLAWKQDLIATIEARRNAAPLRLQSAADVARLTRAAHAYQPAVLRGRFGTDTVFWFTQIENRPANLPKAATVGYHALSPFYLTDGTAVLVDRGFLPSGLETRLPAARAEAQDLPVILRWPDRRGRFDNADKPARNLFYVRDPQAIGAHWGIALPAFIGERAETASDIDAEALWPRGGQTRFVLVNNHLQYAVTWFGLAIVLVIVSGLWHIRWLKSRARTGKAAGA